LAPSGLPPPIHVILLIFRLREGIRIYETIKRRIFNRAKNPRDPLRVREAHKPIIPEG